MSFAKYTDLAEKTILVTGASRGIGRAIVETLASQGASIAFNYRGDEARAQALSEDLKKLGAKNVYPLLFDITNGEQIKTAIDSLTKDQGVSVDGLVNNAGISKDQIVLRLKEEDITQTLDTNLKGAILVAAALSRNFLKAKNVSIVNVSSIVGLMGNPSQIAYSASKAGLLGFTKSYAKELSSRNVRCNAICPGFIKTDMTEALDEKAVEHYKTSIPLGRMGDASEIASLTCFLLSQASSYITGEVIKIDGGLYI